MMQYKPTLIVERLIVMKSGNVVYDEVFHEGINVLYGSNGGGKTSIIQLLVFGLGYEVTNWKEEAGQCDSVYVGLKINGNAITIKRLNTSSLKQSTDICFMELDDALKAPVEKWSNYPYSISANKESFSQKFFSILDIPEIKDDTNNSNITIHQLLRLIYSHQSNVPGHILNVEEFDSAFKREAVGDYLLGVYDDELYQARILLKKGEKRLDKVISKLSAIYSVVGKTSFGENFGTIDEEKQRNIDKISDINAEIKNIRKEISISYVDEKDATESSAAKSIKTKVKLLECENDIQVLNYEAQDSQEFLAELNDKSKSIRDSIRVGKTIPNITFKICPSCNQNLDIQLPGHCHVCGAGDDLDENRGSTNLLRMKNEIDIQIRESVQLLEKKLERIKQLTKDRKLLRSELRQQISKITSTVTSLNTGIESRLYEHYREIGEIEEKIATLDKIAELHDSIGELTRERAEVQEAVNGLKDKIGLKQKQHFQRVPEIKSCISGHLRAILKKDIGIEREFKKPKEIDFDFAANIISINGKTAFSESGTVYLNNAFRISLLLTSLEKPYIRLPRFMILDGIENGGMEDARSKNFQKVVKSMLEKYTASHQLIFATKSISKRLNSKEYRIAKKYRKRNRSLKFQSLE